MEELSGEKLTLGKSKVRAGPDSEIFLKVGLIHEINNESKTQDIITRLRLEVTIVCSNTSRYEVTFLFVFKSDISIKIFFMFCNLS